ncbi:MAG TPA: class I SAM-dependent methyltransferase [Candidatus Acidoferrales bacterium]|nr:class I SAM-dependent methyltransferase [Candidatus Acidoferrales bacterium]
MSVPETDFNREKQWWDAKAEKEDRDSADEAINRALRWREIERHLQGVTTVLDVGAATGAFSIPLAKRGFAVTHLDFSLAMLKIARERANDAANIQFVEGNSADLRRFADRSFDLVLNMDGAISFCGSEARGAIRETCRVARQTVILTVSHRAQMIASWTSSSLFKTGKLVPAVEAMLSRGEWHQDQFPDNEALTEGLTQNYLGSLKAFTPGELQSALENCGMKVLRCSGLGSLAALCTPEAIQRAVNDEVVFKEFLSRCEQFDRDILPDGPGTRQRAGLIAVARRLD